MDRSKRAIKTPKRFDDEAFGPSPKIQTISKPVETIKPTPEPPIQPSKNIIKVKLNKVRPRDLFKPTKEPNKTIEPVKEVSKTPKDSAKTKETIEKEPKDTTINETLKEITIKKEPKEIAVKPKEITSKPREVVIKKEPKEPKEPKELKYKEPPKLKEVKLKELPKFEIKTPERCSDAQLVYRPRTKRPRTPPAYADLIPNVILPFWDARTAAEDHEDDNVKELVHCHCGVAEELGLMVQCETCLTWQHAHCLGIEKPEDAPDGYTCRACSDPKFARESMKWAYDQDWLTKGRMKQFPCDLNPIPEKNVEILRKINLLIGNVLNIHQIIHSLRVKQRILMNAGDDDPELKLFRNQWPASYQHRDGTPFIPTLNNPSSTPASTISAIAETPDPNDITVESVTDAALPDIVQLDDVSAILESPFVSNQPIQPMSTNNDISPSDCRANLRLHIQQTEEFLGQELAQLEEQLTEIENECNLSKSSNYEVSIESLKNDLQTMKKYIALTKPCEDD